MVASGFSKSDTDGSRRRRRQWQALGLVACLVTAGCGSTLDEQTLRTARSGGGLDGVDGSVSAEELAGAAANGGAGGVGGTDGSAAGGGAGGGAAGAGRTGSTSTRSGGGGGGGGNGMRGFGYNEKTATIGFVYADDTQLAANMFGSSTGPDAPHKAIAEALVADMNERGGLLGRTVALVSEGFDSLTISLSGEFQRVCEKLTSDRQVISATTLFQPDPVTILAECLKRKGAGLVLGVQSLFDQQEALKYFPYLYSPSTIGFDRLDVVVERAKAANWIPAGAKVGVVFNDGAAARRALDKVVRPAWERHGHQVVPAAMSPWTSTAATGLQKNEDEANTAITTFGKENVNHVMFVGLGGRGPFVFHQVAIKERYNPDYLYTSIDNATYQLQQHSKAPVAAHAQWDGTIGFGWMPSWDTGETNGTGTPAGKQCFDGLRAKGLNINSEHATVLMICDYFRLIESLVKASGSFEARSWGAVYPKVLGAYQPALSLSFGPKPGRFDGPVEARMFKYFTDCTCFRYTSEKMPLP